MEYREVRQILGEDLGDEQALVDVSWKGPGLRHKNHRIPLPQRGPAGERRGF